MILNLMLRSGYSNCNREINVVEHGEDRGWRMEDVGCVGECRLQIIDEGMILIDDE